MDCDDCVEKLYAFLDKELAPTERKEVAQHLADCGDCDDNFGSTSLAQSSDRGPHGRAGG